MLKSLEEQNKIKGVKINEYLNLTHLLFVDDILLFVEDHNETMENLKFALKLFEAGFRS